LVFPEEEQIEDTTASSVLAESGKGEVLKVGPVSIGPTKMYEHYTATRLQGEGRRWAFLRVSANYSGKTSQGVQIGSSAAEVNKAYCAGAGACGWELETAEGRYVHFKNSRVVFLLQDGKVVSWILYASN